MIIIEGNRLILDDDQQTLYVNAGPRGLPGPQGPPGSGGGGDGEPVFVQEDEPDHDGPYLWVETNNDNIVTFWVNV